MKIFAYCTVIGNTCRISLHSSRNDSCNVVFEELNVNLAAHRALSFGYLNEKFWNAGRNPEFQLLISHSPLWKLRLRSLHGAFLPTAVPSPDSLLQNTSDGAAKGRHLPPPEPILHFCPHSRRRGSHPGDGEENNELH